MSLYLFLFEAPLLGPDNNMAAPGRTDFESTQGFRGIPVENHWYRESSFFTRLISSNFFCFVLFHLNFWLGKKERRLFDDVVVIFLSLVIIVVYKTFLCQISTYIDKKSHTKTKLAHKVLSAGRKELLVCSNRSSEKVCVFDMKRSYNLKISYDY